MIDLENSFLNVVCLLDVGILSFLIFTMTRRPKRVECVTYEEMMADVQFSVEVNPLFCFTEQEDLMMRPLTQQGVDQLKESFKRRGLDRSISQGIVKKVAIEEVPESFFGSDQFPDFALNELGLSREDLKSKQWFKIGGGNHRIVGARQLMLEKHDHFPSDFKCNVSVCPEEMSATGFALVSAADNDLKEDQVYFLIIYISVC